MDQYNVFRRSMRTLVSCGLPVRWIELEIALQRLVERLVPCFQNGGLNEEKFDGGREKFGRMTHIVVVEEAAFLRR